MLDALIAEEEKWKEDLCSVNSLQSPNSIQCENFPNNLEIFEANFEDRSVVSVLSGEFNGRLKLCLALGGTYFRVWGVGCLHKV